MASQQSLDITARSSTTSPTPSVRQTTEVAKLIDESKCIGCKACQVACMTWNDLRDTVGENVGVYDNPADLSPNTWTLMRFFEVEPEQNRLEWLIRKDGCMHCADPGCLKACPAPGAIVQYSNGIVDFISENCIGCGYCVTGCPFDVPRISKKDNKAYKCTLCSDRVSVGLEPACVKTCPTGAISYGSKSDMKDYAEKRAGELRERGLQERRRLRSVGRRRHARHVRHEARRQAGAGRPAGEPAGEHDGVASGRASPSRWRRSASASSRSAGSCTT